MNRIWIIASLMVAGAGLTSCTTMMGSSTSSHGGNTMAAAANPQQPPVTTFKKPVSIGMNQQQSNQPMPVNSGIQTSGPQGGELAAASIGGMSSSDRNRLAHALDAAPGRSTHWVNLSTGVSYTVTPIRKVVINNNHLCREYQTTATRNDQRQEYTGTACITDDGNWHTVSNS